MPEDKTIYFVRHGESTFNEWRTRSLWTFSWIFVKDPMIIDAPLSQKGELQVQQLHDEIQQKKLHESIQLVITSPLTRAIQTALGGFEGSSLPFQVHASCREMLDTACDVGRQPSGRGIDFTHLREYWWLPTTPATPKPTPTTPKDVAPLRETSADVDRRILELLRHLNELQETHIAVVCHSSFIKRATKASRKLANCEIHAISLRELQRLHAPSA
ncbi:hypothetical protein SPRG_19114 [Saprolegnia parasitica CBS 223.65]|uniref:Phosphoglycerate mutase n=1 Tax=Saprolegnia parasitica (strain CBS 223.65) TaxID=695850 RepID=A0A067D6J7_SAPPC|nr:hypothetical protein SPRG_19114 [Saprolegnia parasitica CBS 223.65]KDO34296.1 hypothetical protein SPRG_19114 [Saprolegnia parasitica CBS 223.65]|eukprot:XP_012195307.1 hypothetical protein SPRG_19114 [Saprolegnia parasitica CBS 223.65]